MKDHFEDYRIFNLAGVDAHSYIRKDRIELLKEVDAVIFDCDGVLIDTRGSYNGAIAKTVSYLFEGLTGQPLPESLISDRVLFSFRKSGGFNNDCDLTYAILIATLSVSPKSLRNYLIKSIEGIGRITDPFERFQILMRERRGASYALNYDFYGGLTDSLLNFSNNLDETGVSSVEVYLNRTGEDPRVYQKVRQFLNFPGDVKGCPLAAIFEEFFCGQELFKEIFGIETRFYTDGPAFINNERLIINSETFNRITSSVGINKFGVSSGSGIKQASSVLGELLKFFNPNALIFREAVERAMAEERRGVNLWKPNPFSLQKAAEALEPFRCALYVGDSMEDAIMVNKTGERGRRFLFTGVYYYSNPREEVLRSFLETGCDIIIPSVNDLPPILESVRGEKD